MAVTARPQDHADRDVCIAALDPLLGGTRPPRLMAAMTLAYVPARDAYLAARAVHNDALATERATDKALKEAHEVFVAAFRAWCGSVRDDNGKAIPRQLAAHLGVLPCRLPYLPSREVANRIRALLERLPALPRLAGDLARRAAMEAALDALQTAATADEAAGRAKSDAIAVYNRASAVFDEDWMEIVRAARKFSPDVAPLLPKFVVRTRKRTRTSSDEPPEGEQAPEEAGSEATGGASAGETDPEQPAAAASKETTRRTRAQRLPRPSTAPPQRLRRQRGHLGRTRPRYTRDGRAMNVLAVRRLPSRPGSGARPYVLAERVRERAQARKATSNRDVRHLEVGASAQQRLGSGEPPLQDRRGERGVDSAERFVEPAAGDALLRGDALGGEVGVWKLCVDLPERGRVRVAAATGRPATARASAKSRG